MALSALAFDVTGDASYLHPHLERADIFSRSLFRAPDDSYDWYGQGPGPLGARWGYYTWGHFLKRLHTAEIESIPALRTPGGYYPWSSRSPLVALESEDGAFTVNMGVRTQHRLNVSLHSPTGKVLFQSRGARTNEAPNKLQDVAADGEVGLYRLTVASHDALLPVPQTTLPHEAVLMQDGVKHVVQGRMLYRPLDAGRVVQAKFAPTSDRGPMNAWIEDAEGREIARVSVMHHTSKPTAEVELNPAEHPLPWWIRVIGRGTLTFTGAGDAGILAGTSVESFDRIAERLKAD
jgi:hypothetical protein